MLPDSENNMWEMKMVKLTGMYWKNWKMWQKDYKVWEKTPI